MKAVGRPKAQAVVRLQPYLRPYVQSRKKIVAMNKYDFDYLLEKVWRGDLSGDEIASVVAELEEPRTETNPVVLLSIMCHSYARQYTPLIERYLHGTDDYLAGDALWVLCSCWDLSPRYVNEILAFMESAPQDDNYEERKRKATSCAQLHLERYPEPRLLRQLINVLENENENKWARISAYEALYVITGGDKWKFPKTPPDFDPSIDADPVVMKLAKERLAREEEQEAGEISTS